MLCSTKRLIILLAALLVVEGAAGSAFAGLVIEGDMNSLTAVLLVILAMGCTFGFTIYMVLRLAENGKTSEKAIIRKFASLIFGGDKDDPKEVIDEIRGMRGDMKTLIELLMSEKANRPLEPWEGRL